MDKTCARCSTQIGKRVKSGVCRPCYIRIVCEKKKKPDKQCKDCNAILTSRSRTSLCRHCYNVRYLSIEENRIRRSERGKEWAKQNPEKHREKSLKWARDNKERARQIYLKTSSGPTNRFTRQAWRAKRRGYEWMISREQFAQIVKMPCDYCGQHTGSFGVAMDRIDNSIGYVITNVVPCCGTCNKVKSDVLSYAEMKSAMALIQKMRAGELHG